MRSPHTEEADICQTRNTLAEQCETHAERLESLVDHDRAGRPAGSPGRVLTVSLERNAFPSVYLRWGVTFTRTGQSSKPTMREGMARTGL
jgi:hypothetical protein